jgi:hypothetical protein
VANLALVSSDPANGATGVSVEQVVTLTFDQNVDANSVSGATVQLFRDDTDFPVVSGTIASGKKIVLLPQSALDQDALYRVKIIGSDLGLGYALKASDGTFLATTIDQTFRTGTERFVSLTEVASRTDIERIGPIRESDPLAIQPSGGALEIDERTPEALAAKVSVSLTGILIDFNKSLLHSTVNDSTIQVTQVPVLGLEEYYGDVIDGEFKLAAQLATPLIPPTGVVFQSAGNLAVFQRDPATDFLFNTEVRVKVTTKVQGVDGSTLLQTDMYLFTTEYCPLYSSPDLVRLEMGPAVATLTDDTLCRLIHKNSIEAWELSGRAIPFRNPNARIKRWVLCQTILDVLNVLMLASDLRAGETKTLGDLSIRKQPADPMLGGLYRSATACVEANKPFSGDSFLARPSVKGQSAPGERFDHRMRTWDHLLLQSVPAANLGTERGEKARLSVEWAFAGKGAMFAQSFFVSVGSGL